MDRFLQKNEKTLVTVLCAFAAVRLFVFIAAFPTFNNVDEFFHFDTISKYAQGEIPRKGSNGFGREAMILNSIYGTPEYFRAFPKGQVPVPCWRYPTQTAAAEVMRAVSEHQTLVNYRSGDPPLYYLLAALWCRVGRLAGLDGGFLLYWIRFLNIPIAVATVYLAHIFARGLFPSSLNLRIGAPLLVAFLPQDVFYGMNSDVLSPLVGGACLYGLVRIYIGQEGTLFHAGSGLLLAAAFLTKLTNSVLFPIAGGLLLLKAIQRRHAASARSENLRLVAFLAAAALPVLVWMGWSLHAWGSALGVADKVSLLGWTQKPFYAWWHHPLFTVKGATVFLDELMKTFWRGEYVWHLKPISSSWVDGFYVASSFLLPVLALVRACRTSSWHNEKPARVVWFTSATILTLYALFLVWISIRFDFGNCWYPSRNHPWLSSGRLMLGGLIPFSMLYLSGLEMLLRPLQKSLHPYLHPLLVLMLIMVAITAGEVSMTWEIFKSPYNWFHLFELPLPTT